MAKKATSPAQFDKRVILIPSVVAETVLGERGLDPYSLKGRWFVAYVDCYIRWLHANKADWKRKLEKTKDPRPFVYGFVNHWLDAYQKNPKRFRQQRAAGVDLGCGSLQGGLHAVDDDDEPRPCRIHWYEIHKGRDRFRYVRTSVGAVKKELSTLFGPEEGREVFDDVREKLCDAGRGYTDVVALRAVVAGSLSERSTRAWADSPRRR